MRNKNEYNTRTYKQTKKSIQLEAEQEKQLKGEHTTKAAKEDEEDEEGE